MRSSAFMYSRQKTKAKTSLLLIQVENQELSVSSSEEAMYEERTLNPK